MDRYEDLEKRVKKIEDRNSNVENEKDWEMSITRKVAIAFITYFVIAIYLGLFLKIDPWFNALVPTIGFFLSTLSLSVFKRIWLKYFR